MIEVNYYTQNPDLSEYFLTLPKPVQKRLVESGVELSTLGELMQAAEHFLQN